MERQYSTIDIQGTFFCVDAYREKLWQKDNPKNGIPFNVFHQNGNGYCFLYDLEQKSIPESKEAIIQKPERYCWVYIVALMELDPEGIALRYDIPLEVLCPDRNIRPSHLVAKLKPVSTSNNKKGADHERQK